MDSRQFEPGEGLNGLKLRRDTRARSRSRSRDTRIVYVVQGLATFEKVLPQKQNSPLYVKVYRK